MLIALEKHIKNMEKEELITSMGWKFETTPNPATNTILVHFSIPKKTNVELNVYDISGRKICCLLNKKKEKGNYSLVWKGINDYGKRVPAGVYYFKLKTDNHTHTQKIILMQ